MIGSLETLAARANTQGSRLTKHGIRDVSTSGGGGGGRGVYPSVRVAGRTTPMDRRGIFRIEHTASSSRKRVVRSIELIAIRNDLCAPRWVNIENVGWKFAWDKTRFFRFIVNWVSGNTSRENGIDEIISIFSPRNWHESLETDSKWLII